MVDGKLKVKFIYTSGIYRMDKMKIKSSTNAELV
jgi:hypothetical protein